MAVIHLDFDVDSDVHPELHAVLCAIGSSASRGERFRQLAATGLVWETVRVQGQAAMAAGNGHRAAPAPEPSAGPDDFVDLAIDATAPPDGPQAGRLEPSFERAVRQLPVLVDVVYPIAPDDTFQQQDATLDRVDERAMTSVVQAHAETRPAPNPRLLRMKKMGLFKNG